MLWLAGWDSLDWKHLEVEEGVVAAEAMLARLVKLVKLLMLVMVTQELDQVAGRFELGQALEACPSFYFRHRYCPVRFHAY